jgi:pyridoxine/pyridoxamine 5'-phosphate oxidase
MDRQEMAVSVFMDADAACHRRYGRMLERLVLGEEAERAGVILITNYQLQMTNELKKCY